MKQIYIRTDMNPTIATGHLMRCLAIAKAGRKGGMEIIFLVADEQPVEILKQNGFRYIVLHSQWDDLDSETDILCELIKEKVIQKLLIDTYQVTFDYLKRISELTETFYIDDLNQFIYPVHAIICYANYWEKFRYEEEYQQAVKEGIIERMPKLYLGCEYVPLREEFKNILPKEIREIPQNLLIMSGGSDPFNAIGQFLDSISVDDYKIIHVICGRYNQNYGLLCKRWEDKKNICIHKAVDNLIDYMRDADIAISAGGSTLYELCAVGTPTISYSFADNQIDNVIKFDVDKCMIYIGDVRLIDVQKKIERAMDLMNNQMIRRNLSEKGRKIVDGFGAEKIINKVLPLN